MKYTVRYAHLKWLPKYDVGDAIIAGSLIGTIGSTGQSTGEHLHIDCVVGEIRMPFKLSDIGKRFAPSEKQLDYFIDSELFGCRPIVTTPFMDSEYKKQFGKDHPAIDVVPCDPLKKAIKWNRSKNGVVSWIGYQPESYGNVIYITFDA